MGYVVKLPGRKTEVIAQMSDRNGVVPLIPVRVHSGQGQVHDLHLDLADLLLTIDTDVMWCCVCDVKNYSRDVLECVALVTVLICLPRNV